MNDGNCTRRDFHRLTMAALGGVAAGAMAGCEPKVDPNSPPPQTTATDPEAGESLLLADPHVCRGLNTCKGKGASGENACAGQGTCASIAHACHAQNECKGQGGCGANPGENACKGQGGCSVPLMEHAWESARKRLATALEATGRTLGEAPPKM